MISRCQAARICRARSPATSVRNGMPVSRSVSRLALVMSARLMSGTENLRAPASSCCRPAPSLSHNVQMAIVSNGVGPG